MRESFEQEGYTVKKVQRIAWNCRKHDFRDCSKFLNEVAKFMEQRNKARASLSRDVTIMAL